MMRLRDRREMTCFRTHGYSNVYVTCDDGSGSGMASKVTSGVQLIMRSGSCSFAIICGCNIDELSNQRPPNQTLMHLSSIKQSDQASDQRPLRSNLLLLPPHSGSSLPNSCVHPVQPSLSTLCPLSPKL
jgi:hypothetical protein